MKSLLIALSSLVILVPLAHGQEAAHPCARISSKDKRLACYDQAFPPSQAVIQEQFKQAEATFGLQEERPADEVKVLEAKVLEVSYEGTKRTLKLDNGQSWFVSDGSAVVSKGEAITVRKGVIGSYMLRTSKGVDLRVRRVR